MLTKRNEFAYSKIKEWISSGNLKPGESMSSYKISEALCISRTPIIMALKKLEQEGFIEIIPQVGCRVKLPNIEEARENLLIRAVLEGFAGEMAARNHTDDDIHELKSIHAESILASQNSGTHQYAIYNRKLHLKIAKMSKMEQLITLLQRFWGNVIYQSSSVDFLSERHDLSIREHGDIISAIECGDTATARNLLEAHLRECTDDFCSTLKDNMVRMQ